MEPQPEQKEGRAGLKPRESLRRGLRQVEYEEVEDISEMTEISRIGQNGNSSFPPESTQPLLSDKAATPGAMDLSSPDRRGKSGDVKGKDSANGSTLTVPLLLNGNQNGSVKPLPEDDLEQSS
ncbi:hypothetical protein CgunFtcFv8_008123 [Champsocephalus gunnari]|nr:hypothetical protein CgunFtcFv8_008123 [Champsocephalus gunnari]